MASAVGSNRLASTKMQLGFMDLMQNGTDIYTYIKVSKVNVTSDLDDTAEENSSPTYVSVSSFLAWCENLQVLAYTQRARSSVPHADQGPYSLGLR
jgi:hypothetical protein